jgi:hypothetical protein
VAITTDELKTRIDIAEKDPKRRSSHKAAVNALIDALNLNIDDDISPFITGELSSTIEKVKSYLRDKQGLSLKRISNITSDIRNQLIPYTELDSASDSFSSVYSEYRDKLKQDSKPPCRHIEEIYDELKEVKVNGTGIKLSYIKTSVHGTFFRAAQHANSLKSIYPISDKFLVILRVLDKRFEMQDRLVGAYQKYINQSRGSRRVGASILVHDYVKEPSAKQARVIISNRASIALRMNKAGSSYLKNYFSRTEDLTDQFTKSILEINSYKTTGIVAGRSANLPRTKRWKTIDTIPSDSSEAKVLNQFGRGHRKSRSAENFWSQIGAFFSFQTMPTLPDKSLFRGIAKTPLTDDEISYVLPSYTGLGVLREDVNFFSLLSLGLISDFYDYCTSSDSPQRFIKFASSFNALLNDSDSYFLISKFAKKNAVEYLQSISEIENEVELPAILNEIKKSLSDMQITIDSDFKNKSESFDNISFILDREVPLSFLAEVYKSAEAHYVKDLTLQTQFVHCRNLLLTHFQMHNPLRVSSLVGLTIPKKNGALRPLNSLSLVSENGKVGENQKVGEKPLYQIVLDKNHFKNIRSALDDNYIANFPLAVEEDLHTYLEIRELWLKSNNVSSDFLFVSGRRKGIQNAHKPMSRNSLSSAFKRFVTTYRPTGEYGYRPFGLHSNRHIVATNYLRENPEHYVVVAEILHDKIETVLKTYAHLSTSKGLSNQEFLVQRVMSETRMVG